MEITLLYVAAVVYAVAALSLLRDIWNKNASQLYSLLAYFGLIAVSFAASSYVPVHALAAGLGGVAILLLPVIVECMHKKIWSGVVIAVIAALLVYAFLQGELVLIAHSIALTAMSCVALYILFSGAGSRTSLVIGILLLVLGVVAHLPPILGLQSYEALLAVALLSPFSLILALFVGKHLTH